MNRAQWVMLTVAAIWASTYSVGRVGAEGADPYGLALLRFVLASVVLLALLWRQQGHLRVERRHWPLITALALTSVLAYNVFFFASVQATTASRVAMVVALNPMLVALAGVVLRRTAMHPLQWLGIVLGLSGVLMVLSRGDAAQVLQGFGRGEWLALGCAVAWSAYTLLAQRIPASGLSSLAATAWAAVLGTAMLLVPAALEGPLWRMAHYTWQAWAAAIYLGLIATALGFVWWADSVRQLGITRAVAFIHLVPILAVLIGVLLLGESMHWSVWLGGVMATAGTVLTHTDSQRLRLPWGGRAPSSCSRTPKSARHNPKRKT